MNLRNLFGQSPVGVAYGDANHKPLDPMQKPQLVKITPQQVTAKKTKFVPQGKTIITKSETPPKKLLRLWI